MHRMEIASWIGLVVFAGGHGLLAWTLHEELLWPLRTAPVVTGPDPRNEGTVVAVSGPLDTDATIDDPEYVMPGHYAVLAREIEESYVDSDDDQQWRRVDAHGPVRSARFYAPEARVGGFAFSPSETTYASLLWLKVEGPTRRVWDEPSSSRAAWDETTKTFVIGPLADPTARLVFEGMPSGISVTVIGRQEGRTLRPFIARRGEAPRLFAGTSKLPPAKLAAELEGSPPGGARTIVFAIAAAMGLVLVFSPPPAALFWGMTCGVGTIFGALAAEGIGAGVRHLVKTALAFSAVYLTVTLTMAAPLWLLLNMAGRLDHAGPGPASVGAHGGAARQR